KVPPTIQSRCQRFDFRAIPATVIGERLGAILKQEKVKADAELVAMVARLGNGSMRDALSLLDRLMASGEKKLTVQLLEDLLGLAPRELVGRLIDSLVQGEPAPALDAAGELVASGTSIDQTLEALIERLRDLMVLAACGPETSLVELSGDARSEEVERAKHFDPAGLVHMIALCEGVQRAAKSSPNPRALMDALVVRLAMTEKLADVTGILNQLAGAGAGKG
ncbi:MAG: hypothetical protein AAF937_10150, partial [Planctomycetota bacterium]